MMAVIKALVYTLFHYHNVYLTIVRRYVDAQSNFIGELYMGEGREAKMIGMTCDSLPFDMSMGHADIRSCFDFAHDFTDPMGAGVIRVGSLEPANNETVRNIVSLRRYCPLRVTVLNRFVEHVMEKDHVRK